MIQLPVVGNDQQAGRVLVKPANRLYAALSQLDRQQLQYPEVVLRLARTLVTGRLVQHQHGLFLIRPVDTIDGEYQAIGRKISKRIVAKHPVNQNPFVTDQPPAGLARAETMFVQDAF